MSQTRMVSLVEAGANVGLGLILAFMIQISVFPLIGLHATLGQNALLASVFTAVSLLRGYTIRRLFEALEKQRRD